MDPNVEALKSVWETINKRGTSPEEVAQALVIVVDEMMRIRQELIDKIAVDVLANKGEAKRGIDALFEKVRRLIDAVVAKADKRHRTLRRLIDGLVAWKAEQDAIERIEDNGEMDRVMGLCDENTLAIQNLRSALKEIEKTEGPPGPRGRRPNHEWDGTKLRFENPDKTWGEWVDLQGPPGAGNLFGGLFGGGVEGIIITNITSNGSSGPATLSPSGVLNIPQYVNSGGGTTQSTIDPSETPDDSRLTYTFSTKPFLICVNNRTYRENHGWTWSAGVATLSSTDPGPVGTGGEIYGIIQT